MKTIKSTVFVLVLLTASLSFSQNKNERASLEVDGVCLMCKKRIEKASLNTKGVKSAIWNVETHELKLIFDERKTNLETVSKSIVAVGHDTKSLKSSDEAYAEIHPCCKYRDEDIVKEHKD